MWSYFEFIILTPSGNRPKLGEDDKYFRNEKENSYSKLGYGVTHHNDRALRLDHFPFIIFPRGLEYLNFYPTYVNVVNDTDSTRALTTKLLKPTSIATTNIL